MQENYLVSKGNKFLFLTQTEMQEIVFCLRRSSTDG